MEVLARNKFDAIENLKQDVHCGAYDVTKTKPTRRQAPVAPVVLGPSRAARPVRSVLMVCAIALAALMGIAVPAAAQETEQGFIDREYPLKALFLYNFASYIKWPDNVFANNQEPFVIGVLGKSPIDDTLKQIAATPNKKIDGRRIVIQDFDTAADIKPCQILFVSKSIPSQQQQAVIAALKDRPVLIVGESDGFAKAGGSVNFLVAANKIRFEINLAQTKKQQLDVSSKLLSMASIVGPEQPDSIRK
jgi:YfiR/HmsC-like